MQKYRHIVQYYETDKMGITHHSNYIRWMEEARIDFLRQIGWDYAKLESIGIISPVIAVNCKYKKSTTFEDVIDIDVIVEEFKEVKLKLQYTMINEQGEIVCQGYSEHGFINPEGKLIRLKREYPNFYHALSELAK